MNKTYTRTELITNSTDFFFEKGREALNNWLTNYELTEEDKLAFQEVLKDYKSFAALTIEDKFYDIKELFFEIIAYCDEKAKDYRFYNKYEDNRSLALAFVRMPNWCNHIFNYKYNRELTSPSVFNALEMLSNPTNNINALSEKQREKISKHYLNKTYDKNSFVNEIVAHFNKEFSFNPVNEENLNLLVAIEIYKDQSAWDIGYEKFKDIALSFIEYVQNLNEDISFGKIASNYMWIFDKDEYFNGLESHFELFSKKKVLSIDLHFENVKCNKQLENLFNELPDFLEWKKWQGSNSISHKKKFKFSDSNIIEEAYEAFVELFDFAYPNLINKLIEIKENKMNTDPKIQEYVDLLDYKKQIILKGPPGTGKTKYAEEIAKFIISNQIDFDSSEKYRLTKEDILKNISVGLEIPSKSGRTKYTIVEINDGHIVSRSENSKPWYPTFNKIILSFNNELYKEKNRTSGFESYEDAIAKYLSEIIKKEELKTVDIINYDLETSPFYKIVQFHPSYTYEDFVRGITTKPTENGTGIEFEGVNKVLADFATKAYDNPSKKYVLVIDEINRANLSSVFGELIYALEYRDKTVTTMYEVDHSNELTLPSNLYIIGTMNTADRSVGHIDYAIRRRFAFVHIGPKILPSNDKLIFASDLFIKVEQIFKDHISTEFKIEDVQLGHSYFIDKSDDKGSMPIRLEYEIKPILIEYVNDGILKESALEDINNLG
ncbi:MAG: McrB family protein [Empedobacter falsenii]